MGVVLHAIPAPFAHENSLVGDVMFSGLESIICVNLEILCDLHLNVAISNCTSGATDRIHESTLGFHSECFA